MINLDNVYFHFTNGNRLRDGSPVPPIGKTLVFKGTPKICVQGFHASKHPSDALKYAPGTNLHIVTLGKIWEAEGDKVVSDQRTILFSFDSEELLRRCARKYASDVLHLWNAPDIVKKYLTSGDPVIRDAAGAAAWAAGTAAWAAGAAARAAAWAAEAAAWAAGTAAWDAAWAADRAAGAAAGAAARAAEDAAWAADRDAAGAAARAAARATQREYLLQQILKEIHIP